MATIAFIGLGHMGGPMAANLVKAGHEVRGFDIVPELRDAARTAGALPRLASRGAHVVRGFDQPRRRSR